MATYNYSQLEQLWKNAGGSAALAPVMAAIALAESSGIPTAVSPTDDYGLWQINQSNLGAVPGGSANVFNPADNASAAVTIEKEQGLSAWTTYTSGKYRQYLQSGATVPASAGTSSSTRNTSGTAQGGIGGLLSIPSDITGFFSDADKFVTALMWLAQPQSWVRIGAFIIGVGMFLFALYALMAVAEGNTILPSVPTAVPV